MFELGYNMCVDYVGPSIYKLMRDPKNHVILDFSKSGKNT